MNVFQESGVGILYRRLQKIVCLAGDRGRLIMKTSPDDMIVKNFGRKPSGFTLAEIAVVLILVGIILSVTIPRLTGVSENERLRTAVRRLVGQALEAHSEATTRARPWFLCLDLKNHRSWLSSVRPGKEGEAGRESDYFTLPAGVAYADAVHPQLGMVKNGRVSFGYWPQGGNEPGTIHLKSDNGKIITIFLRPYMGRTEIKEGYLREETS